MKNLLLLLCCLFSFALAAQNILTVRQGFDDGTSFFSSIQAAVDAAIGATIVYVYPGVYNENVLVDKAIRIVGPGYRLNENHPGAAWTNVEADLLGSLTVTGDEGVIVEGMKLRTVYATDALNVTFQRCWVFRAEFRDATVRVKSVYFSGGSWGNNGLESAENQLRIYGQADVSLVNSIFPDAHSGSGRLLLLYGGGGTGALGTLNIERCFFRNALSCGRLAVVIKNSFAYENGGTLRRGVSFSLYNNFTNGTTWGGNNIRPSNASEWQALMVGFPTNSGDFSFDTRYQIAEDSPAVGAADDGGDVGPFSGFTPYTLSGTPALPFIYDFQVPEEGTTGSGLPVNIKVRTQN